MNCEFCQSWLKPRPTCPIIFNSSRSSYTIQCNFSNSLVRQLDRFSWSCLPSETAYHLRLLTIWDGIPFQTVTVWGSPSLAGSGTPRGRCSTWVPSPPSAPPSAWGEDSSRSPGPSRLSANTAAPSSVITATPRSSQRHHPRSSQRHLCHHSDTSVITATPSSVITDSSSSSISRKWSMSSGYKEAVAAHNGLTGRLDGWMAGWQPGWPDLVTDGWTEEGTACLSAWLTDHHAEWSEVLLPHCHRQPLLLILCL